VQRLGLQDSVHPVLAAVLDIPGPVHISYSERNSLLAQITQRGLNPRAGDKVAKADGISLDGFCSLGGAVPRLVKIDVEGSEAAVLRGARGLLSRPDRPAILFEYNPVTLTECGAQCTACSTCCRATRFTMSTTLLDKIPFGGRVQHVEEIDWICNLFAVPLTEYSASRWASILKHSARPPAGRMKLHGPRGREAIP
jgi:FkbM family methyltransferase